MGDSGILFFIAFIVAYAVLFFQSFELEILYFVRKCCIIRIIKFQEADMGIIYTKSEIIQKCEDAFKDIPTFYRAEFVKYTGITRDTKELYTEIIAEFLLDKMKEINAFFSDYMISRERSYFTKTHDGHYNSTSNHIEEITAMQLFNQCKNGAALEHIGSVIDYQTPLKDTNKTSAGKIDLLLQA